MGRLDTNAISSRLGNPHLFITPNTEYGRIPSLGTLADRTSFGLVGLIRALDTAQRHAKRSSAKALTTSHGPTQAAELEFGKLARR